MLSNCNHNTTTAHLFCLNRDVCSAGGQSKLRVVAVVEVELHHKQQSWGCKGGSWRWDLKELGMSPHCCWPWLCCS
jgi:hypothetical protein